MERWGDGEMGRHRDAGNNQCPMPYVQCPMPNAQKNCAAIRSKGQSHISHDLDKLDSVSLQ
jgi:hypothetical protein